MNSPAKKRLTLRKHEELRLLSGHQWVFSNEVGTVEGSPKAGDLVEVVRHDGKYIATAMYHPHSLIAARILTRENEEVDFHFFERRIRAALALREKMFPHSSVYRVVHGESDFLPGLIVDRYNEYLSVQTFSAGMDSRLTLICDVLVSIFSPRAIVERNEAPLRELEDLPQRKGVLRGTAEPTIVEIDGLKFRVDVLEGQKTGFYLDQRLNRTAIVPFADGAAVLDCFSNEGGFGLHASRAGAARVECVDSSRAALDKAAVNAKLNALDRLTFRCEDSFAVLSEAVGQKRQFDIVVLDPPSFTKSRKTVATALRGYRELNTAALRLLRPGGVLATASCSHHVTEEAFLNVVAESAVKAGRAIRMLRMNGASPDHPTLPAMPETAYLKFGLFSVD